MKYLLIRMLCFLMCQRPWGAIMMDFSGLQEQRAGKSQALFYIRKVHFVYEVIYCELIHLR